MDAKKRKADNEDAVSFTCLSKMILNYIINLGSLNLGSLSKFLSSVKLSQLERKVINYFVQASGTAMKSAKSASVSH